MGGDGNTRARAVRRPRFFLKKNMISKALLGSRGIPARTAFWLGMAGIGLTALLVPDTGPLQAEARSSNPFSGDTQAIREGKSMFRGICAVCHGSSADGKGERGQGADLRKFKRGFKEYLRISKEGRETGLAQKMPAWGGIIADEDLMKIGAFLETLALEEANWKDPE